MNSSESETQPSNKSATRAKPRKLDIQLPYLGTPGTIKTALDRIRQAAEPERVHLDFVNTILKMKGGTGASIIPFLKKIGLVASDGSPTELYKKFRNPSTGGASIATAIKQGYKPLGDAREYFYKLDDKDLLALIVEVTGAEANSSSAKQTLYSLNALKEYANFDTAPQVYELAQSKPPEQPATPPLPRNPGGDNLGLNLAYTINLNLPATTDQAVFNAIFKSLKEHLLSYVE